MDQRLNGSIIIFLAKSSRVMGSAWFGFLFTAGIWRSSCASMAPTSLWNGLNRLHNFKPTQKNKMGPPLLHLLSSIKCFLLDHVWRHPVTWFKPKYSWWSSHISINVPSDHLSYQMFLVHSIWYIDSQIF